MTKLNTSTKKAEYYKRLYKMANYTSVSDFYGRCSSRKISIETVIRNKMRANDCFNYRVLCGNCFYFTCAYTSRDGKKLFVETAGNTFIIDL